MKDLQKQEEVKRLKQLSKIFPDFPCAKCHFGMQGAHCTNWRKPTQPYGVCYDWWKWFQKTWKQVRKELGE